MNKYMFKPTIFALFAKGGYVYGSGLSVCLSVSEQHYSKNSEWIAMTLYRWYMGKLIKLWQRSGYS